MMRHLTAKDFKEMPWANGKGITVEMLRIERDARLVLRLSRAMVDEDGPFSLFPGIERNLTVLSGPGFDLRGDGLRFAARPLVPVAFSGDISLRAEGVAAPSEDFNVMTDRAMPRPEVWVQQDGIIAAGCMALALKAGTIGGVTVARHDLVILDQALAHDRSVIVVRAVIV